MVRIVMLVAGIALGVTVAAAQSDPIAARKELMKKDGDDAKIGVLMAKGEAPFDLAAAKRMFATFEDVAAKAPSLFPDNSKAGDDTEASPKIWEDKADFIARFEKFGADAKAAQTSVTDLESFKAVFGKIGKEDCGGCHELYRIKKS